MPSAPPRTGLDRAQAALLRLSASVGLPLSGTLIETGPFHGDAVAACLSSFARICSIELDEALYRVTS